MLQDMQMPPKAEQIPVVVEKHGDKRTDNYFWMNERDGAKVIDYLEAENAYYQAKTKETKGFQERLFSEIKARIKEDDESVPYKYNGYWYLVRYEKGKEYPIYSRKKETLEAAEEVLFDCNKMAEGQSFFELSSFSVSPDNTKVAFGDDLVGRRMYTIKIKNLLTGEIYPERIKNTAGEVEWANDNKTIFYIKQNPKTLRSETAMKHILGQPAETDLLVYREKDEKFSLRVEKTKSEKYLFIVSSSTTTSEYRLLNANLLGTDFEVFHKRTQGLEYSLEHYGEFFYILTNADGATNFKLMKTPEDKVSRDNWATVVAHREETLLEDIEIFKDFLVVNERTLGLNKIYIKPWNANEAAYYIPFDGETYVAHLSTNLDFNTTKLRYTYSSLTSPKVVVDFDMATQKQDIIKRDEVLGGSFDEKNYTSERIWATGIDGAKIPISLVYRKDTAKRKTTPLLLYGYGSYGITINPSFSSSRLSLLDRGFIFAIAHIRGEEYLGRSWYEDGKLLNKKNTFYDFISCSKHLIDSGYTSAEHLYALGGSAGGLLMGAIMNMAPQLYAGVVAEVPFVDVVTTMLDESIPLTTGEYEEWGNPNEKDYYHYMKSYSPYDNVTRQNYPNIFVTTGYHDSQVQYWEPAKWVAKLRELKTDSNTLLFYTNMDAGHSGASGRYQSLRELAQVYAFLLGLEKISE